MQDLTSLCGVSLIPIREALRRLEAERLVETTTNKGARVAAISIDDVQDAYATRVVLEEEALRRAWDHITTVDLEELWALRSSMLDAFGQKDYRRGSDAHRALHFSLYSLGQSKWLNHLVELLWSHTERHRRLALSLRPSLNPDTDWHGKILDAIAVGDLTAAVDALRCDLIRTADLVSARYQTDPVLTRSYSG